MSEEENCSKSTQQTSTEPNKSILAPQVTFVLNHAIPKVEKGQQQLNESANNRSEK